jgi:hypothetical protein
MSLLRGCGVAYRWSWHGAGALACAAGRSGLQRWSNCCSGLDSADEPRSSRTGCSTACMAMRATCSCLAQLLALRYRPRSDWRGKPRQRRRAPAATWRAPRPASRRAWLGLARWMHAGCRSGKFPRGPRERMKERSTPVSRRASRGHSVNEDHLGARAQQQHAGACCFASPQPEPHMRVCGCRHVPRACSSATATACRAHWWVAWGLRRTRSRLPHRYAHVRGQACAQLRRG